MKTDFFKLWLREFKFSTFNLAAVYYLGLKFHRHFQITKLCKAQDSNKIQNFKNFSTYTTLNKLSQHHRNILVVNATYACPTLFSLPNPYLPKGVNNFFINVKCKILHLFFINVIFFFFINVKFSLPNPY